MAPKNNSLTVEEQAELAQLRALEKKPAASSGLSAEEQDELAQLRALEAEKSSSIAPQEQEESSTLSDAFKGLQKGVTMSFSDELAGLAGALGGKSGGDTRPFSEIYKEAKQSRLAEEQAAKEASPNAFLASELGGGLILPGFGAAGAGNKALGAAVGGGAQGLLQGFGQGEGLADSAKQALIQGSIGTVLGAAVPTIASKIPDVGGKLVNKVKEVAKKYTSAATGATPSAALKKFKPGTEEFLLQESIVGMGDTAESIATKAINRQDDAGKAMGAIIEEAEKAGVSIPAVNVVKRIDDEIASLRPDASKADVITELEKVKQNIINSANGDLNTKLPPSLIERTKSGFQANSNYTIPGSTQASKTVASIYRDLGEEVVGKGVPNRLAEFQAQKAAYGYLDPVIEAAEMKAKRDIQSAPAGLLDIASSGAGFLVGGPMGIIAGPVLQRAVRERGAATIAGAANIVATKIPRSIEGIKSKLPEIAAANPQLAGVLQQAVMMPATKAEKFLAPLMSQIGDQFEDSEYPSMFEGKLYSEEDKQAYSNRLKDEMQPIERAKALSALNKDGSVIDAVKPVQTPVLEKMPVRTKPLTTSDMANNVPKKQRPY